VSEETTDSVFHRKVFSICDIIGNFENGFILIHFEGFLYLVDQHAASEKSLFLQYMINPTKKYSSKVDYKCYLPNYYRATLAEKAEEINSQGWKFV
jgi:DNA mismatch repair ATPase MutL